MIISRAPSRRDRPLRIAFFGHNAQEPTVGKRARAFASAGYDVIGVMPYRGTAAETGFDWISLGRTRDNSYAGRIGPLLRSARLGAARHPALGEIDLIYARNLDMLACAHAFRHRNRLDVPVVYECLDIHDLLVGEGRVARWLRGLEGALLRRSRLLVYSSPRFESAYFAQHHPGLYTGWLMENRLIASEAGPRPSAPVRPEGRRLRLGWVGNLRCRRSFELMAALAERFGERLELRLHGYPARAVFPRFEAELADTRMIYFGPYSGATDLPQIYGGLDLVWAGDWFAAGHNSNWLIPNRIYEGGHHGVPAIAPAGTETGRRLMADGTGWALDDPAEDSLPALIERLLQAPEEIERHSRRLLELPASRFVEGPAEIRAMVEAALDRDPSRVRAAAGPI
ncbi:hypothetical protein [Limimaricola pyoseonensis]|uniref:Succinoglycan biosynthesis protein ExoL n=1 Tax=Limimaricola pyoseonensis TaxID=521013 RepID=A0A1G7J1B4_9RHOB|nr:hypothetical protein [Limimaricola pyoseonensis]SDF18319.1 succinoglycan biosynthesis protein ExoL [Limimaricola pyoseonensis]